MMSAELIEQMWLHEYNNMTEIEHLRRHHMGITTTAISQLCLCVVMEIVDSENMKLFSFAVLHTCQSYCNLSLHPYILNKWNSLITNNWIKFIDVYVGTAVIPLCLVYLKCLHKVMLYREIEI